ncbi:MAG TPA: ring-cleaving dioxygenase [Chthoniobacterales bacterium]|nr:ring-cleaving dioxygenase [Chthoniobacterales bacterium]
MKLRGIHHITAIATEPQRNLDFYTNVLGLRLVKRTVNFDDPSTYHFYFGDRTGRPGTVITFFPWPGARRGTRGVGQVVATSFAIPQSALDYWKARFEEQRVLCEQTSPRFGDNVLRLADPDGLLIELITSPELEDVDLGYKSDVPNEFAIHGFHAATLEVQHATKTANLLETFGFEIVAEDNSRRRFSVDEPSTSAAVDLMERPDGSFGVNSAGTVHHIAFRCADEAEQLEWRKRIVDLGLYITPVIDRQYFHSIYFREPAGILFEIATDGPGFTADEPVEHLGGSLKLPPQYEAHRAEIERILPPVNVLAR